MTSPASTRGPQQYAVRISGGCIVHSRGLPMFAVDRRSTRTTLPGRASARTPSERTIIAMHTRSMRGA